MADDQQASPSSAGAAPGRRIYRGGDVLLSSLPYVPPPATDWRFWEEDALIEQMTSTNIGGGRGDSIVIGERRPEQRMTRIALSPAPFPSPQSSSSTLGNPPQGELFDPYLGPLGNGGARFQSRGPPFDLPWTQRSADRSRDLGFLNPANAAAAAAAEFAHNPHSLSLGDDTSLIEARPQFGRLGQSRQIHCSHAPHLCSQELLLSSILLLNSNSEAARRCVYCTAKDQHGCQILLRMITTGTPQIVHIIYLGIINHVAELMRSPVAHQLVQTLLDVCTEEHRLSFLSILSNDRRQLFRVSLHPHG